MTRFLCSADLPMNFEDRVAAVGIATQFQEARNEVFKMVEEETEYAKTQVTMHRWFVFKPDFESCKYNGPSQKPPSIRMRDE